MKTFDHIESSALTFPYGEAEIGHLKRRDPKLGQSMEVIGKIERRVIPDLFTALVKSIVGQQIANKAAATVWSRMCGKYPDLTPQSIAMAAVADIQQCGMSMRKAAYIQGIGQSVVSGRLDMQQLSALPDEMVVATLCAMRGVGVWTAEMLLIFSMCRPDVVSWGDLGIRRGMMRLYGLKTLTKSQFDHYRQRYAPHGSVASFYLWELACR